MSVPMNNSYYDYILPAFQTDNSLTASPAVDFLAHLLQMLMVVQHQPPDDRRRTSTPVRVGSKVQEDCSASSSREGRTLT